MINNKILLCTSILGGCNQLYVPIITELNQEKRINYDYVVLDVFNVYAKYSGTARAWYLKAEFYDNEGYGTKESPGSKLLTASNLSPDGYVKGFGGGGQTSGSAFCLG